MLLWVCVSAPKVGWWFLGWAWQQLGRVLFGLPTLIFSLNLYHIPDSTQTCCSSETAVAILDSLALKPAKYLSVDSSLCESWQGPKISSYCSQTQTGTRHSKSQLTRRQRLVWVLAISSEISFYVFSPTALCPSPTPPQSCHRVLSVDSHQFARCLGHMGSPPPSTEHQHLCTRFRALKQLQFSPME